MLTLALSILVAPLVTDAQQAGKVVRIGMLFPGTGALPAEAGSQGDSWGTVDAFRHTLREQGWVEG
jgi:hypothetical protein